MSPPKTTHRRGPFAPQTTDDLLGLLRVADLLNEDQLSRLAGSWHGDDPVEPHLLQLVQAGLLTSYQADVLRTGRLRRLRLGPYRLLDQLGNGSSGPIFRAEHRLLGRSVVLKILRTRTNPRSLEEIRLAGQFSHTNIVAAHHAGRIRGSLVLVMEYLEGIDLERMVDQTGPLPVDLACDVIRQTCLALDHLYQHRFLHRDVKPANLLLTHDNMNRPVIKLLDLGLACSAGSVQDELCGTPDYLAPERGVAGTTLDIRGDLYSLGCTFYQLLTGRVPFPGDSWPEKLLSHHLDATQPITEFRSDVPAEVITLVNRLMARDPNQRPATPGEVLTALATFEPAPPATVRPELLPTVKTPRKLNKSALTLAVVFLGAVTGTLFRWATIPNRSVAAEPVLPRAAILSATAAPVFDLARKIATASDGDTITVPAGHYELSGISLADRSLVLKATPGTRPVLKRATPSNWNAVLEGKGSLTLIGLELSSTDSACLAPMIQMTGGKLHLRQCILKQSGQAPVIALRQSREVKIEHCEIHGDGPGIAMELPKEGFQATIRDSQLHVPAKGVGLLAWTEEGATHGRCEVKLTRTIIHGGRVLACRAATGPIQLNWSDNKLFFTESMISFAGYEVDRWRKVIRWQGENNSFAEGASWLTVEGQSRPVQGVIEWQKLWVSREE